MTAFGNAAAEATQEAHDVLCTSGPKTPVRQNGGTQPENADVR